MLRKRRSKTYEFPLDELSQEQLLQQILLTLERMETLLERINRKVGGPDHNEEAAEKVTAWINRNTEALSDISLIDPEPKDLP